MVLTYDKNSKLIHPVDSENDVSKTHMNPNTQEATTTRFGYIELKPVHAQILSDSVLH